MHDHRYGLKAHTQRNTYAYCVLTCNTTALVAYEHLITLKYEVNFLCGRKWSAATWIFVMNRYLLLAYVSFSSAPFSPQVSGAINPFLRLTQTRLDVSHFSRAVLDYSDRIIGVITP